MKPQTKSVIFLMLLLLAATIPFLQARPGSLPRGLTEKVICTEDTAQNYCLYLPTSYTDDEIWPVIFLFDPMGNGIRAVEHFIPAAEEFGYILAGSNTTGNSPWEDFLIGANAIFKDVEKRFKIDPYRRYTAGFSGAAEAASGLAVMYDGIIGVIGCGAGFSKNYAPHFDVDFHYIGLIGDRDSHYQEMQKLHQTLDHYKIDNYVLAYPGGHDWPPPAIVREAIIWLQFNAMKHDIIAVDYWLIMQFYNDNIAIADSLESHGDIPAAYDVTTKILAFLDGLKRLDPVEERRQGYLKSPMLEQFMTERNLISAREQIYTQVYKEAFDAYKSNYIDGMTPEQPLKWWNKQVKLARSMSNERHDTLESILGGRLLDYIWRNAYQNYKTVLGTDFDPISIKYLQVWKVVQPDAISPYFFSAKYYVRYGKDSKAISNLREAVHNGLNDPKLLENDPVLSKLNGEQAYMSIIQHLYADLEIENE